MIHVNRLIIVAGPSCVGKTSLLNSLQHGPMPRLPDRLQIGDIASWTFAYTKELRKEDRSHVDRMILHYDMGRYWKRNFRASFKEDTPLDILDRSSEIYILTLWAPPGVLLQRYRSRILRGYGSRLMRRPLTTLYGLATFVSEGGLRRYRRMKQFYKRPAALRCLYEKWFAFCEMYDLREHWVVDTVEEELSYSRVGEGGLAVERVLQGVIPESCGS